MIVDLPTSMIQVPDGQEWIAEMINAILIEVLSSMAEQERLEIRARQKEGIDAAKERGVSFGRPRITKPDEFDATYRRVLNREITAKKAMELLGLKPNVFYQFVKEYKEGGDKS